MIQSPVGVDDLLGLLLAPAIGASCGGQRLCALKEKASIVLLYLSTRKKALRLDNKAANTYIWGKPQDSLRPHMGKMGWVTLHARPNYMVFSALFSQSWAFLLVLGDWEGKLV